MRRARISRAAVLFVLAGFAGATGCTHYHYYGAPPQVIGAPQPIICEPQVQAQRQPAVVQYGSVCEVPPVSSGSPFVAAPPRRSEVIVSRPQGAPSGRRASGSRFAWHRPDPENLATTRVEGGLDESAVR
jgi:hypothetical protein